MGTPELVPTADAARRLKVTPRTIRRWLASGRLRGQRIGCILVVDDAAVDAELEQARRDGRA
jgi:excisionase family DNA binding protein